MQIGNDGFLSIAGTAIVSKDQAIIDELWNKYAEAWFEQGREDPTVALLQVKPTPRSTGPSRTRNRSCCSSTRRRSSGESARHRRQPGGRACRRVSPYGSAGVAMPASAWRGRCRPTPRGTAPRSRSRSARSAGGHRSSDLRAQPVRGGEPCRPRAAQLAARGGDRRPVRPARWPSASGRRARGGSRGCPTSSCAAVVEIAAQAGQHAELVVRPGDPLADTRSPHSVSRLCRSSSSAPARSPR